MGPLATLDLIGLDTAYEMLVNLHARQLEMSLTPASIINEMVAKGELGKKLGVAFMSTKSLRQIYLG